MLKTVLGNLGLFFLRTEHPLNESYIETTEIHSPKKSLYRKITKTIFGKSIHVYGKL